MSAAEAKVEGMLLLDGLVEGNPPSLGELEGKLHDWTARARQIGLPFHLAIDGGSFSLLAENRAIPIASLQTAPSEAIEAVLNSLLEVFPVQERGAILSTVRSVEYRRNLEVQTIYAVGPEGIIHTRQRLVETQTVEAEPPVDRRTLIKYSLIGVGVAAVLLAVSAFFVPYGKLFRRTIHAVTPLKPGDVNVQTGPFEKYLTAEVVEFSGPRKIHLRFKRTAEFPTDPEAWKKAYEEAGDSYDARLTLDALRRGYIVAEVLAPDGKWSSSSILRVVDLQDKDTDDDDLPFPEGARPAKIVLRY